MQIYTNRVAKVQRLMSERGFDLMVLFPSSNMLYLSGFYDEPGERMLLFLVPREGDPVFVAPQLYEGQIKQESPFQDIRTWRDTDNPVDLLRRILADFELRKDAKVLVDDGMWATFVLALKRALPEASFSLASPIMSVLRIQKTPDEIRYLERAGAIVDEVFSEIIKMKLEGRTELSVAAILEEEMRRRGAEKVAFDTIVASGPNSALPHHRPGQRAIEPGDVVILDFGCRVRGYCSDISRTIVCGEPSKEVLAVYEIVKRAQEKAVQAVRPSIVAQEVDRAAREEISQAGFGEWFIHRTGHGIGIDVHEEPFIAEGNDLQLKEGMTFSVEPGIYLPERFGIRVEDIVVVTKTGAKRLNNCTHDLQVVN